MIGQRSGSIINIASMSGRIVNHPQPQVAYNASKAGVVMLTKSLGAEWAPYGVRVNSISPGYTGTELTMRMKDLFPIWESMTPMNRLAKPDEMKGAAVYLASEASAFVTGHDLVVDGGFTLW
jgi:NAD(P)-dependent dehydrogenase (short-subunit alcohol dehydrogenase family)